MIPGENMAAPQTRVSDPRIDDLFARQTRSLDPSERTRLVNEIAKNAHENTCCIPGLWWARTVVHWAKVKNYVWISED